VARPTPYGGGAGDDPISLLENQKGLRKKETGAETGKWKPFFPLRHGEGRRVGERRGEETNRRRRDLLFCGSLASTEVLEGVSPK
jgi:hypothetical protein